MTWVCLKANHSIITFLLRATFWSSYYFHHLRICTIFTRKKSQNGWSKLYVGGGEEAQKLKSSYTANDWCSLVLSSSITQASSFNTKKELRVPAMHICITVRNQLKIILTLVMGCVIFFLKFFSNLKCWGLGLTWLIRSIDLVCSYCPLFMISNNRLFTFIRHSKHPCIPEWFRTIIHH